MRLLTAILFTIVSVAADNPDDRPTFAVASIKPSDPGTEGIRLAFSPGGRLAASNVTLRFLIKIAYNLRDDQIDGGPAWLGSKRYNVEGKSEPPVTASGQELKTAIRLRLQSLLEERFQLKLTESSKEMPVYFLVVAKSGPKMHEVKDAPPGEGTMRGANTHFDTEDVTLPVLARYLEEQTGRVVFDKTGLTAHYAFQLTWSPDPVLNDGGRGGNPADAAGPSLFTAIQEQLGLKLEPHKAPAPFFIVSRAELPNGN